MMGKSLKNKASIICLTIAVVHTIIVTILDRGIFEFPQIGEERFGLAVLDYSVCKILTVLALYAFYSFLKKAFIDKDETSLGIIKCGAWYAIVLVAAMVIKLPAGFLTNDEYAIYQDAVTLTHDTWFNYMTVYYYIVSLMILPIDKAPIIIKVIIEFLTVGYTVYRSRKYFGPKVGLISYALFLLYPVIAYTTSAHRLPIYFLIYLWLIVTLAYDRLDETSGKEALPRAAEAHTGETSEMATKEPSNGRIFMMLLAGVVLTQWRTEGIYLLVLVPILLLLVYPSLRLPKRAAGMIIVYLVLQYVISIPQNGLTSAGLDDAANDRMKPFYAYTITNMYRNGLDMEKNAEDLAIVDRYMDLDAIEAINEHYGDINYEDVLILYQDGFVGVREEASVEDFINYSDALKRIFIANPDVFLRTRIGAFCYAALPFHISFGGMGIRELVSFGISIVKTVTYNLFIPLAIAVIVCLYSLIRRRWFDFFVSGGLLAHWAIVFILAPASYFKYYFPLYIVAYFYVALGVMMLVSGKGRLRSGAGLKSS